MRASWYADFGAANDIFQTGEQDAPSAGDGEGLVRVHASGSNPLDVKRRAGMRAGRP